MKANNFNLVLIALSFASTNAFAEGVLKLNKNIILRSNVDQRSPLKIRDYSQVDYEFKIYDEGILEADERHPSVLDAAQNSYLSIDVSAMNDGEKKRPDSIVIKAGSYKINCLSVMASFESGSQTAKKVSQTFSVDPSPVVLVTKDSKIWKNAWTSIRFTSTNFNVENKDTDCDSIIKNNLEAVFSLDKTAKFIQSTKVN